jgi:hypothetical protein
VKNPGVFIQSACLLLLPLIQNNKLLLLCILINRTETDCTPVVADIATHDDDVMIFTHLQQQVSLLSRLDEMCSNIIS